MVIVENEKALIDSLFNPIDGKTADGYIIKRLKRRVYFWYKGKERMANKHGVIINHENGKFSYADDIKCMENHDLINEIGYTRKENTGLLDNNIWY